MRIFLVFTDQIYYAVYVDEVGVAGGIGRVGRDAVLEYLSRTMREVYEGFLDEEGKPMYEIPSQSANS